MESIWFYDFSFTPLLILHDVFSVNWELYFNDVGTFELHTAFSDEVTKLLRKHKYLVVVQGVKQGIIVGWRLTHECVLYGRTCNWLLTRRVMPSCGLLKDTAENITRKLVQDAFADTPELSMEAVTGAGEVKEFELSKDCTLFEAVKNCLDQDKAGHWLRFDSIQKMWFFGVGYGRKQPIVLSEDNGNVYNCSYSENGLEAYGGGWYRQKDDNGGGEVWTYISPGEEETGMLRWECLLGNNQTETEAKQLLEKKTRQKTASAVMKGLTFGKDYELGDRMELSVIRGGFSVVEEKQINGVHIWYEADSCGEEPMFN